MIVVAQKATLIIDPPTQVERQDGRCDSKGAKWTEMRMRLVSLFLRLKSYNTSPKQFVTSQGTLVPKEMIIL